MNPSTDTLFLEALQLPAGPEREAFLDQVCGQDAELRRLLGAMLADDSAAEAFFDGAETLATPPVRAFIPSEKPGDVIGRFKFLQVIGEGGFGVVSLADQREPMKRRVARKILKPGMDTSDSDGPAGGFGYGLTFTGVNFGKPEDVNHRKTT